MHTGRKHYQNKLRPVVVVGLFMMAAFVLGQVLQAPAQGPSTFEAPAPRQPFLSGGERSEQVLRDISATLKQIEGRLARIELTASDAVKALHALRDKP